MLRVRELVQRLGKRAWIWEDFFEYFSESEIARLPRDIVLCFWQYTPDAVDPGGNAEGHFNGLGRRDVLALYDRLGFDALVCPRAWSVRNAVELTRYARSRRVLGGIQTIWELGQTFLPLQHLGVAVAGARWSDPTSSLDRTPRAVIERILPTLSADDREIIELAIGDPLWPGAKFPAFPASQGPLEAQNARVVRLCESRLERMRRAGQDAGSTELLENLYAEALNQRHTG